MSMSALRGVNRQENFDPLVLREILKDVQNLKFASENTAVSNVSNASNVAFSKQIPVQIGATTYYLMLDTAAR